MLHHNTFLHPTAAAWVTFVHGAGGSSAIWYQQVREFSRHFNVLLVDLRGHGGSKESLPQKLKKYSFEIIGNEVMEVLDHLKIHKSHFVGISLGTIIIRDLTERFPERVSSMVLAGAVMKLNVRGQVLMRLGALLKSLVPYLLLYRLFAFVIMPRKNHRESRNLFIGEAKKLYQKEFKRWFKLASQVNPLLSFFRIKDSGVSTLYVMGAEDHMFLPSITKLVENHESSRLQVIQDCGHVVNVEKPEIFNSLVLRFLKEQP